MQNRNLISAALAAGIAAGSSEAAIVAVDASNSEDAVLIGAQDGPAPNHHTNIAELMYAGDANVGAGPSPAPVTIRAPVPAQPAGNAKTGDTRGTGKVRQQNEKGPRQMPGASKKGA